MYAVLPVHSKSNSYRTDFDVLCAPKVGLIHPTAWVLQKFTIVGFENTWEGALVLMYLSSLPRQLK